MHTVNNLLGVPTLFLDQIFYWLEQYKVDMSTNELDHICYRVTDMARYLSLKNDLAQLGTLLVESEINGRAIATYKLNQPITYQQRNIWCIELPAPKPGSFYAEGYEHVEFVIEEPFEVFMDKYSSINYDVKGMSKKTNPDIRIKLGDLSIKFHHHSLEYVIKYLD